MNSELSIPSEGELQAEWQRQVDNFVRLGFHEALGMTEEEYSALLPQFGPQPEAFKGRFDIPLLVETRISFVEQAKRAGFTRYLDYAEVRDWEEDPEDYQTPDFPYTTWMQDGQKYIGRSVSYVRSKLHADERGGTVYDGIAFHIAHPNISKAIDLPGTSVEFSMKNMQQQSARLCLFINGMGLTSLDVNGSPLPGYGSLTCARRSVRTP